MSRSTLIKWLGCGGGVLLVVFACVATLFRRDLFPTPQERRQAGVQKTLDLLAEAYNTGDEELLDEVFDPANPRFKRIAVQIFNGAQDSFFNDKIVYRFTATSYATTDLGYVLVNVRVNNDWATYWYFREENGRWWLSEPTRDQLGEPLELETEHFHLVYYAWSADILPLITETLEAGYTQAVAVLEVAPKVKSEVEVVPLTELVTLRSRLAIGVYVPEEDSNPPTGKITIVSPHTYVAPPYILAKGWKPELTVLMAHEYTHLLHHQVLKSTGWHLDWWTEGLAEYVAADKNALATICYAVDEGFNLPIWTPEDTTPADLTRLSLLQKDKSLAYGLAHLLVIHVAETYGGLPTLWKLAKAYDERSDLGRAVRTTLGVSYEEFDTTWQAWLEKRCVGGYYHAP